LEILQDISLKKVTNIKQYHSHLISTEFMTAIQIIMCDCPTTGIHANDL